MKKSIVVVSIMVLVILLAVTLAGTFMLYGKLSELSEERTVNSSVNTLNKTMQNLDLSFQHVERIADSIMMDSYITSYFMQPIDEGSFEWLQRENDIRSRLYNYYITSRTEVRDIVLVKKNGMVITSNRNIAAADILESDWFQRAVEKDRNVVITAPYLYQAYEGGDAAQCVSMIKEYDLYGGSSGSIGHIVITMDYSLIGSRMGDFNLLGDEEILLVSEDDDLVYATDETRINENLLGYLDHITGPGEGHQIIREGNLENIIAYSASGYSNWIILSAIPISDSLVFGQYMLFFIVFYVAVIIIFSYLIVGKMLRPIVLVQDKMAQIEQGNLDIHMEKFGWIEIDALSGGFNSMMREISNLIERIIHEEDEKARIQLKILQSQINPHFLYNTLNTIGIMAKSYQANDIVLAVASLIDLLRISISNPDEFIAIEKEIGYVESYINIQRLRYSHDINVEFSFADGIRDSLIPKLILQPIVENALFHGIEPRSYMGTIKITGRSEGGCIAIDVVDDGVGMTTDELQKLQDSLREEKEQDSEGSIGIHNVNKRLKLYFGEEYGVSIRSEQDKGTCVTLTFPKIEGIKRIERAN